MYELYYLKDACSLATQVVLYELKQKVKLIDKTKVDDFKAINPIGTVPVLIDGHRAFTEGAAIMLHLLKKHKSSLFPTGEYERQQAIQEIMFANATMHPAYSKLFFIAQNITNEQAKTEAFSHAAENINHLWQVVETKIENNNFLGGVTPSAADIMLAVYSRWGEFFPVDINFGNKTLHMLSAVQAMPSFKKAIQMENEASAI